MISISIVEDDIDFCELLVRALSKGENIRIASRHASAEEALKEIPLRCPDVVLMDIKLPGMSGIECLRRLRGSHPSLRSRVLILTEYEDSDLVFEALKAGARGYLLKDKVLLKDLWVMIQDVSVGGAPMSPSIACKVVRYFEQSAERSNLTGGLSVREGEILDILSHGLMYKEIADRLNISLDTVKKHVGAIYKKLHVHTRTEATWHYFKNERDYSVTSSRPSF